jgi:phage tail-like protein
MARPVNSDFMQNFKFALIEIPEGTEQLAFFDRDDLAAGKPGMIGCKSISLPEISTEPHSIIEGTGMFEHHINSGRASTGECVITLGVIPLKSVGLYSWIHRAIYGFGVPRKNFAVVHFGGDVQLNALGARKYTLEGCIPTSYKIASDLDATDDEVSLEEITLAVHRVLLEIPNTILSLDSTFDF